MYPLCRHFYSKTRQLQYYHTLLGEVLCLCCNVFLLEALAAFGLLL